MRIHKADYQHLYQAGLHLSDSDRFEMELLGPGRNPVDVLTAVSDDPDVLCISDDLGNVLATGGHASPFLWFVHTERAQRLSAGDKVRMLRLLADHLIKIKREAVETKPEDSFHFTNIVSVNNTAHIKLLKWLGAVWCSEPHYVNGHEFKQFFF